MRGEGEDCFCCLELMDNLSWWWVLVVVVGGMRGDGRALGSWCSLKGVGVVRYTSSRPTLPHSIQFQRATNEADP